MSLGKTERKHKRDHDEETDLSRAMAPNTDANTGLSMGSFSAGLEGGSYLEDLLGEQELIETRKKQERSLIGPENGNSSLVSLSDATAATITTDPTLNQSLELPPTILDRLVNFICSTLEDLEQKLLSKEEKKLAEDEELETEEELFEAELKRLAHLKDLQSKALRLQKILQARELARRGNYSLSESLDEMSDQEIDAMIAEMKLVEEWLIRNGRLDTTKPFL
jgi:hypothetical protein